MRSNIFICDSSPFASASSRASSEPVCMYLPSRMSFWMRLRRSLRDWERERFDCSSFLRLSWASALSALSCCVTVRCLYGSPSLFIVGGSGAGLSTISLLSMMGEGVLPKIGWKRCDSNLPGLDCGRAQRSEQLLSSRSRKRVSRHGIGLQSQPSHAPRRPRR